MRWMRKDPPRAPEKYGVTHLCWKLIDTAHSGDERLKKSNVKSAESQSTTLFTRGGHFSPKPKTRSEIWRFVSAMLSDERSACPVLKDAFLYPTYTRATAQRKPKVYATTVDADIEGHAWHASFSAKKPSPHSRQPLPEKPGVQPLVHDRGHGIVSSVTPAGQHLPSHGAQADTLPFGR